jgi:serine/threonine protein phosphatase 1
VLLGDHDEMLLESMLDPERLERWLRNGGTETLISYGWEPSGSAPILEQLIPASHLDLLKAARPYFETDDHIFLHAGYVPELSMADQPALALRRRVCQSDTAKPHCSGKTVIAGHTAQRSGDILDLGFVKCIDTNCVRGGWLTALDVTTNTIWQANQRGQTRRLHL